MSKTISISDDVYKWLKSKKGDRSFSEYLRQFMGSGDLKELEGIGFSRNWEEIESGIEEAERKQKEKIGKYDT